MAPVELPDPSMHTIYIVDPAQMFTRYAAAFAPTARMREGAQAGFLVLARLSYLAFGALPGFFATRYVFALIAVVPAYVLMRRLYGIPAALTTVLVIMSCPVVITAWGTDYPDCAVVSYVAGAVACLAMPSRGHARRAWIALAVVLLSLATFSHGMGAVLCATTIGTYGLVRLARQRAHLLQDAVFIVAVAALTTLGLMGASRAVLGQFNLITPSLRAATYLNRPDQLVRWHSANWRWAPYVAYLLVPPSVVVSYLIVSARRWRDISTPQVYLGAVCALQLAVFSYLQFAYHVQALEMHFFSSTIWGTVCLALGVVIAEITRPLWARPLGRWLPAVLVVAVALGYEADPHVREFGWWPNGAELAAVPVLVAVILGLWSRRGGAQAGRRIGSAVVVALGVVGLTGSLLVLTVAPRPPDPEDTRAWPWRGTRIPPTTRRSAARRPATSTGTRSAPSCPCSWATPATKVSSCSCGSPGACASSSSRSACSTRASTRWAPAFPTSPAPTGTRSRAQTPRGDPLARSQGRRLRIGARARSGGTGPCSWARRCCGRATQCFMRGSSF